MNRTDRIRTGHKRERIKRRISITRELARHDVFDDIKMCYKPKRRHSHANDQSPVEYEKQYFLRLGYVLRTRVDSRFVQKVCCIKAMCQNRAMDRCDK